MCSGRAECQKCPFFSNIILYSPGTAAHALPCSSAPTKAFATASWRGECRRLLQVQPSERASSTARGRRDVKPDFSAVFDGFTVFLRLQQY